MASETDISDAYVQLGNEFKVACRAFSNAGVDVSDLGDVPHSLRIVLEEALCESPSQESLDKFLPSIREIIVSLLQNLKTKQAVARQLKVNKSRDSVRSSAADEVTRRGSINSSTQSSRSGTPDTTQRPSSAKPQPTPSQLQTPTAESTTSPTPAPPPAPTRSTENTSSRTANALAQLQKGDSLQRRASRRFSAYQYAKLTSYSPGRDRDHELPDQSVIERTRSIRQKSPLQGRPTKAIQETDDSQTLNIFIKIGERVKKCRISTPITFTALRLLFVEKFAYSPGTGQFPDIYIQDKASGVDYELEESLFSDVEEGSVISLNVNKNAEALDTVSRNIEELKEQLKNNQDQFFQSTREFIDESNNGILQKLQALVETASAAVSPSAAQSQPTSKGTTNNKSEALASTKPAGIFNDISDILDIRHEISVIKQINTNNKVAFKDSIDRVLQKVRDFKSLSLDTSKSSMRTYVEESHQKLSNDSDALLTKFDDLQDLIEALRKDVAQRGARPSEKQLDYVAKQLDSAQNELDTMVKYIDTEKPHWKKIWETELDTVCQEQQFLTLQEDLAHDLREDLEKATETFDLVKQCCEEQTKNPRTRTKNLPLLEPGTLPNLRDALLSEVAALKPNHDSRVEAIEKAEKLRERERELSMLNGFEEELGGFVEENKLKKSGGIEEVERVRRMKDEQNLRSAFPPLF